MAANINRPKNMALRVERFDYRMIFSKTGRARFISHLDLMRTFSRIFKRARIPVWYTQGFNPRLYIMFPLALALGTESDVEIMDISLTEELDESELMERVNAVMPEGMHINKVYKPVMSHKDIAFSEYEIRFCLVSDTDALNSFKNYLSQEQIIVKKHSKKKGEIDVDIKPDVQVLSLDKDGEFVRLSVRLPSGNDKTVNSSLVMDGYKAFSGEEYKLIYTTRTKILTKSLETFI